MNSSVTVAGVEQKKSSGGKPYLSFTDSTGKRWTYWDGANKVWHLIKPGALLDLEWEQNGKYQNIVTATFKGETEPPPPPEPAINHEKQESIESQNALTNLTTLMAANMLTDDYLRKMSPLEGAIVNVLMTRAGINVAFLAPQAERMPPMKSVGKPNG